MVTTSVPEGKILVGTDGSEKAQRAVAWAAREAEMRGSTLTILTAWTAEHLADATLWAAGASGSKLLEDIRAQQVADATGLVEKAAQSVRQRYPDLEVRTIAIEGDARHALVEYGSDASLVVVGSRGRGPIASVALGSVAFWLTRHATMPLAVVPTGSSHVTDAIDHSGVVAGVSLDPLSSKVVEAAAQEAEERRCDLVLAYCAWDGEASRHGWDHVTESELDSAGVELVERLARLTKDAYPHLVIRQRFARGSADHFLADISTRREVLVLGRRKANPLDLVGLGSVATAVFHDASCVVIVVPLTQEDGAELAAEGHVFLPAHAG